MKNMNTKIEKLLREGFTMKTLSTFNEKQIDVLLEKVTKKETKEAEDITTKIRKFSAGEVSAAKSKGESLPGGRAMKMNQDGSVEVTLESEITEKSVSKKQHGLMGAAYAVKKGEEKLKDIPKSYRGKVEKLTKSMDKKQLKDFASTKEKGLPEKKEEVKKLEESIMKLIDKHFNPETTKGDLLKTIKGYKR
jgi:hypothetical protein